MPFQPAATPRTRTHLLANHRVPLPARPPPIALSPQAPLTGDPRIDQVLSKLKKLEADVKNLQAHIEFESSKVVDRIITALGEIV
jgi:hypothetical protein